MQSTLSVIIPVYNHAHTIGRCLESINWQGVFDHIEIIIVNDGSTDGLDVKIHKILVQNPKIAKLKPKIIEQDNLGASAARNRGFTEATGQFTIFLDADTICRPQMLAELKQALDQSPEAAYAYSQYTFGWKKMKSQPFSTHDLRQNNFIDTTSLIRTGVLKSVCGNKPFDEKLARFQDWDLWLTFLEHKKIGIFVPKVLFKKIIKGRTGYSRWLPKMLYKFPIKFKPVTAYNDAKLKIIAKHSLASQ